jgi:hypothetical protein
LSEWCENCDILWLHEVFCTGSGVHARIICIYNFEVRQRRLRLSLLVAKPTIGRWLLSINYLDLNVQKIFVIFLKNLIEQLIIRISQEW